MVIRTLFRSAFGSYARAQIRAGLDGVHVRGLLEVVGALQSRPVVLAATHASWWDGMLLLPLDEELGRVTKVWMHADNLNRLPFFESLGAIALHRDGVAGLRSSTRAATSWLSEPGRALWVFPQGEQRPGWARPLGLRPGAVWLARKADAALVPVAIRYGFREAARPAAAVSFGTPVEPRHLEGGLLQELHRTDRFFLAGDPSFESLVAPKNRRSEDGVGTRMLTWLVRGAVLARGNHG